MEPIVPLKGTLKPQTNPEPTGSEFRGTAIIGRLGGSGLPQNSCSGLGRV